MSETIKLVRLRGSLKFYQHLKDFLEFLYTHGYSSLTDADPNWQALEEELENQGVDGLNLGDISSTLRMLGIVGDSELTAFGTDLYNSRNNPDYLKNKIAKFMLIEKKGWAYCEILKKLPYVTRDKIGLLYEEVYDREGFQDEYTDISKYNIFLNWLGVTRLSAGRYKLVEEKYNEYMGFTTQDIELLDRELREAEKYCLLALIKLNSLEARSYRVKEIRDFVFQTYNYKLNIHNQNAYGRKLVEKGFIEYGYSSEDNSSSHQRGQQGIWRLIENNPQVNEIITKILEDTIKLEVNWSLIDVVELSFSDIASKMNSEDDAERGIGLEQFASKICWILGLKNIKINYRESGLELDVIANQEYPIFTRFLIQCKNKRTVTSPATLYKELGVASTKKFDNIMIFSKSGFSSSMREVAEDIMVKTGINVYLFDREDIEEIINNPESLLDIIKRENLKIKSIREKS